MPTQMELLLLATGFTGALTLRWLLGLLLSCLRPTLTVTPHFVTASTASEVIVQAITAARREVLLVASAFTCRPIAQALVEARLRGVNVEVILDVGNETDPGSDLHFLVEQGLPPMLDDQHPVTHNHVILDGITVLTGQFTLAPQPEAPITNLVLAIRSDANLAGAFRQEFQTHKAHARAVPAKTAAPTPAKDEVVANVAESIAQTEEAAAGPMVTPASAELFARLRQELATSGAEQQDRPTSKNKKKAS